MLLLVVCFIMLCCIGKLTGHGFWSSWGGCRGGGGGGSFK